MRKLINQLLYLIAVLLSLSILYDVIAVSNKSLVLAISLAGIVLMALVNAWWPSWVAIYEYRKWYNALPAHHQNQVDLYKHTSDGYGRGKDDDDHTTHIVV